jgi:hypothetical protein
MTDNRPGIGIGINRSGFVTQINFHWGGGVLGDGGGFGVDAFRPANAGNYAVEGHGLRVGERRLRRHAAMIHEFLNLRLVRHDHAREAHYREHESSR